MVGSMMTLRDGKAVVINTTGVEVPSVAAQLNDMGLRPLADALSSWSNTGMGVDRFPGTGIRRRKRVGGLFDRDRWLAPEYPLDKIRMGRMAITDDIIGGAADGTESLILSKTDFFCEDGNEEDLWNQIAGDINLDDQLRKMWRILFTESQTAYCTWYDTRSYKVRGKRDKAKARKTYDDLTVPVGITFLDGSKIVPVDNLMFGKEKLAYLAGPYEALRIDAVLARRDGRKLPPLPRGIRIGNRMHARWDTLNAQEQMLAELLLEDPLIEQMVLGRYRPGFAERYELERDGIECSNLFLLNPAMVSRHCLTRPDYQRFADVRLESCFEILDAKAQLRQMDRAHLIGATNYLVLIRKGSEKEPADQKEIDALKAQAFSLASIPVVVGDHRLQIDIITPKTDHTLDRAKYDALDIRLFSRAWQTFLPMGADRGDQLKTAKVIAKGLESRRLMMRRHFELNVVDRTRKLNASQVKGRAVMKFHPSSIALDFDAAWASFLLELRASNDISRSTTLSQFDLSQEEEAQLMLREKKEYDAIFQTQQPFSAPNPRNQNGDPNAPMGPTGQRAAGRRAKGGGAAPGTGQGQEPVNPLRRSNENQKPAAAELADTSRLDLLAMAREMEIPGRHRMKRSTLIEAITAAAEEDWPEDDDQDEE